MNKIISHTINIGHQQLTFETGKFARQSNGAVMVRFGDTMILATAVVSAEPKKDYDYFPLQIEYREKLAAAGKIPGGFLKREGRPTDKEVLSGRLIDRSIRPLFPDGYRNELQVIVSVYSSDKLNDADVIGACAASASLLVSGVPFNGPIAEVRIGRINGKFIVNPSIQELKESDIDMIVAGTSDSINMVEGESREISETDMLDALKFGHAVIKDICKAQLEFISKMDINKSQFVPIQEDVELKNQVNNLARAKMKSIVHSILKKDERSAAKNNLLNEVVSSLQINEESIPKVQEMISNIEYDAMREMILSEGKRLDGRGLKDIRPISVEVGLLPRTHGSALFTRGETQSLTTATLGTSRDEQILDGMLEEEPRKFMLHYNFPPFSTGEIGRIGTSRREIGHGNLAERSLKNLISQENDFAYTIRVVSDILESNGSSSMATVCAGSLALFDAGVPLKKAVAGIAMGLIKEGDRVAILSDILGNEDFLGDMDFKVAGTKDGITAFQMDIKIQGISIEIFEKAINQAKDGRMHILKIMDSVIDKPRTEISAFAPQLIKIKIPIDSIGAIIGPGGKNIRQIIKDSGVEDITIDDDGVITIAASAKEASDKALQFIKGITAQPEVGTIYKAKVKKIVEFGAFVEILPGKEGLVHISQLDIKRVEKVSNVVKLGDVFEVKLLKIDDKGRLDLSRKAVMLEQSTTKQENS
ncbi:MAG: polyribonucleotide nucleotidyltransferase [Bacteroidetes bacterium]|nr:polyribonucleotide nucleotidyltransferase [Bacteroidota bacterium]